MTNTALRVEPQPLTDDSPAPLAPALRAVPSGGFAPRARISDDDLFGQQPTGRSALPDPDPLIENLARCVIEVLAGARDLEQLARWVTEDVYRNLLTRVSLAARARQVKGQAALRPSFRIGSLRRCEPRDGVVEAVVTIHGRARSRAVAIRLEGLDSRWRATVIAVL